MSDGKEAKIVFLDDLHDTKVADFSKLNGIGKHGNKMGFIVMNAFMDSVDIKSKIGKGTTVLMRKRLAK